MTVNDLPLDQYVDLLVQIESEGNLQAVGDVHLKNKAYGPLQIRQPAVDDVNKRFGTKHKARDCLGNMALSRWIFDRYMEIYATPRRLGHEPTNEEMGRIWNGGPDGYKKASTRGYAAKVAQQATDYGLLA